MRTVLEAPKLAAKIVTLRVLRANPAQGFQRHFQTFEISSEPGMTILSALLYAKERLDHSIAIQFSCRVAACGSCGMKINGIPKLACYTQVADAEYIQTPRELEDFLQFSYCIKCGLCNAACPKMMTDPLFTGPQALGQAYRYVADSRDEGVVERVGAVDNPHGLWRCHYPAACTFVCPKGVDPAFAIQRLKRVVVSISARNKKGAPLFRRQAT